MAIVLYDKATGQVSSITRDLEALVKAWLAGNPEIAAQTGYLVYDEVADPTEAQKVFASVSAGGCYVRGGALYQDDKPVALSGEREAAKLAATAINASGVKSIDDVAKALGSVREVLITLSKRA